VPCESVDLLIISESKWVKRRAKTHLSVIAAACRLRLSIVLVVKSKTEQPERVVGVRESHHDRLTLISSLDLLLLTFDLALPL